MAEYTNPALKSLINSELPDNTVGSITAANIRENMKNVADSIIPIMASGSDVYFKNDIDIRDNSVTGAGQKIGSIFGQWDTKHVAEVRFVTGADTSNKDDGEIHFLTAEDGRPRKSVIIDNHGSLEVLGSGNRYGAYVRSVHGSGVNLLLDGHNNIAYPSGQGFSLGHWKNNDSSYTHKFVITKDDKFGFGITNPEEKFHIRGLDSSLRYEQKTGGTERPFLNLLKYGTDYSYGQYRVGFGLGVFSPGSGTGYFYIGTDSNRDKVTNNTDASFVLDSGGHISLATSARPEDTVVIGSNLGTFTPSGVGTSVVVGHNGGPSQLIIGSGAGASYQTKWAKFKWHNNNKRLAITTKKQYEQDNQLVLDASTGYVGVATSGAPDSHWTPAYNFHVYNSGSAVQSTIENATNNGAAIYIGAKTEGSGNAEIGFWSAIGYKASTDVLKINNSGSLNPSNLTINRHGNVGLNTAAPYAGNSIGTNRLHVYGDDSAVLIGTPVGGAGNSALRLLGSRSTNDSAYIQAGTTAADTGAKLAVNRFDTDSTNINQFNVYSDASTFHGSLTTSSGVIISQTRTPLASSPCSVGHIAWDTSYLYVCTASNTWKRITLSSF